MEEPALLNQCHTPNLSSETYTSISSSSHTSPNQFSQTEIEEAAKHQIASHTNQKSTPNASSCSSSSNIISFGSHSNASLNLSHSSIVNFSNDYGLDFINQSQRVPTPARAPLQAKHHAIAERKNRERLCKMFKNLLSLIPGLKKLDKASVLEGAIKYIKQLEKDVKALKEEVMRNPIESAIVDVKKSRIPCEDYNICGEIEVRVCENNVFIRVFCKKENDNLGKILNEIEKFHLNIINSSVMPFGHSTLAITIIAQIDIQFSMEAMDLEKSLTTAFWNNILHVRT